MNNNNNNSYKDYIYKFIFQYKFYFSLIFVIAIISAIFEISVDYKIKEIIDSIAANQGKGLGKLLTLFIIYKLSYHGVHFIIHVLGIKYHPLMLKQVIVDIYKKIMKHSLSWFESHLSGEITNKIYDFQSSLLHLIKHIFKCTNILATIVIMIYFLLKINKLPALVLIGFILVYTPVIYILLKKQLLVWKKYIKTKQKTTGVINDSITNIFGIKIVGNLDSEFKLKLAPQINKWSQRLKEARKFDTYFVDSIDTILIVIMSAIQIYLLAYLFKNNLISAGAFAFIAMITLKIHTLLSSLLEKLLFDINPGIAEMKSSYRFANQPIDVKDKENAYKLDEVEGNIEYSNVVFSYEGDELILDKFNLNIKAGEQVGIVGTSGSGKTTLTKCLLRYFDINSGSIKIDGHDIKNLKQKFLRNIVSIIPQEISLFHRTIRENLKIANYDATEEEIISACKKAKIHEDIMKMPEKYNTIVGERGSKLSGGQKQRIAIARAILKNAPILILDEATSSLDTATEILIQESINEFLKTSNATVIAIAHRLSTLKYMGRIIVMEKGNIIEEGTHKELIQKKDGFYKKLWYKQVL